MRHKLGWVPVSQHTLTNHQLHLKSFTLKSRIAFLSGGLCFLLLRACSHSVTLCYPFVLLHPRAFGNQPPRGNVHECKLIFVDSKRPICFPFAWLHRRRNWWGKAAAFTSGVTDWVTACRPRMAPLWKGPLCSPLHLRLLCTTGRYFTSVLWTGPSASIPYPEQSFLWAFLYSTSSIGSHIKCCDTRTSMQICKALCASFSCCMIFLGTKTAC